MHHLNVIDLIDKDDTLVMEQDALDAHDDDISQLSLHLCKVMSSCTASADVSHHKILSKRLLHLETMFTSIATDLSSLPSSSDEVVMLHQFEEQLTELKRELTDIRNLLYTLDLEDSDNLIALHATVEKPLFDLSLNIHVHVRKRLSHRCDDTSTDSRGLKLLKIDVPKFNDNLLHWCTFWEQFEVVVHNKTNLSEAEKLVYLQHVVKGVSVNRR